MRRQTSALGEYSSQLSLRNASHNASLMKNRLGQRQLLRIPETKAVRGSGKLGLDRVKYWHNLCAVVGPQGLIIHPLSG
jgi:hypothetical protein